MIEFGLLVGFVLGLIGIVIHLTVINTRRWHERHHQEKWDIMCDRCLRENGYL